MKIPEHKLKWLEKQLKLYDEQEGRFLEDYCVVSASAVERYLERRKDLAGEPLIIFLREYVKGVLRSYEQDFGSGPLLFDASAYDERDLAPCVTWCIDLLQAYDKWNKQSKKGESP